MDFRKSEIAATIMFILCHRHSTFKMVASAIVIVIVIVSAIFDSKAPLLL